MPNEQDPFAAHLAYEHELARLQQKYATRLGVYAVQSGLFIAETEKLTDESDAAFQERLRHETQKQMLQSTASAAFIIQTFDTIDTAEEPCTFGAGIDSISGKTPEFENPEAWLAHHTYTNFVIPPANQLLGEVEKQRRFGANKTTFKPMPVWVVGEQMDGKEWEYLAVTSRVHSGELYTGNPLSKKFHLFKMRTDARLPEPESYVPSQAELEAAYDKTSQTLRFDTTLPPEKAAVCPKIKSMEQIYGVSDAEMQGFAVAERLMKFPGAYEVSLETTEAKIADFSLLRQQISNWDGRFNPDSLREAFGDLPQTTFCPLFFNMGVRLPAEMYGYPDNFARNMAISLDRQQGYYSNGVITLYS